MFFAYYINEKVVNLQRIKLYETGTDCKLQRREADIVRCRGGLRLADNTLVALTLMIAESKTEEKDMMVKVVVNLINQRN